MKDIYKPLRKRLASMAETWQPLFGLDDYDIKFEYWDRPWGDGTAVMHVNCSWCYKWATIRVNMPLAATRTKRELEGDLLHEIGHVVAQVLPIKPEADEGKTIHDSTIYEERFVTDLSQTIQRIAETFYKKGKADAGQQHAGEKPQAAVRVQGR